MNFSMELLHFRKTYVYQIRRRKVGHSIGSFRSCSPQNKVFIRYLAGLRQDFASTSSTAPSSRRRSSFSLQSLRRHDLDLEEEDEEDESYDQLPPPQPRLFRTGSMQRVSLPHSHTFSSIRDCRRISATPHYSHSGLSQFSGPSSLITEAHTAYRSSTGGCLLTSLPFLHPRNLNVF